MFSLYLFKIKLYLYETLKLKPTTYTLSTESTIFTCTLTCKDVDRSTRYIGESARTMYLRGLEHAADIRNPKKISHMRDHIMTDHPELITKLMESPQALFSMQAIYTVRSALSRQIRESVEIGANTTGGTILNSKEEFSRCQIPVIHVEEEMIALSRTKTKKWTGG